MTAESAATVSQLVTRHVLHVTSEGLLEWFPDLGLDAGWWSVRVSTAGGDAAELLEDQLYEQFEAEFTAPHQAAEEGTTSGLTEVDGAVVQGPERWLVQLWR